MEKNTEEGVCIYAPFNTNTMFSSGQPWYYMYLEETTAACNDHLEPV